MTGSLAVAWALARKDLLLEFRSRDIVVTVAGFSVLVLAIFTFAVDLSNENARLIGPGVLWAGIAFAGVLGLNRSIAIEADQNALDALMLTPVSRDLVFLGKAIGNFVFLAVAQAIVLPVFAVLFNQVIFRWEVLVICHADDHRICRDRHALRGHVHPGARQGDHAANPVPADRGPGPDRRGRSDFRCGERRKLVRHRHLAPVGRRVRRRLPRRLSPRLPHRFGRLVVPLRPFDRPDLLLLKAAPFCKRPGHQRNPGRKTGTL